MPPRLSTIAIWAPLLHPAWGWAAWLLAFYVGWSRVALGIHYVGDVVAGWVLGGVIGLVCQRLGRQERQDDKMRLSIRSSCHPVLLSLFRQLCLFFLNQHTA